MKVVHVASIYKNSCNGVCVAVPFHVRHQARGCDAAFLNLQPDVFEELEGLQIQGPAQSQSAAPGARMSVKRFWSLSWEFAKCLLEQHPDLVVFHEAYNPYYIGLARRLSRMNIPYVIVPHSQLTHQALARKSFKKHLADRLGFSRFFKGAAAIQCLSQTEKEQTAYGPCFVASNGMECPKHWMVKTGPVKNYIYIGRLEAYQKGLDVLLEGWALACEDLKAKGCHLHLYGPDHQGRRAFLEQKLRELNIEDTVTLYPPVLGREKETVLLWGDVFVQTSRFEGMPLGLLEALSYGLPCLASAGTTLMDSVEESNAGWGCESQAHSIAQALLQAADASGKDLKAKSMNARKLVETRFSWGQAARQTLEAYRSLCMKNTPLQEENFKKEDSQKKEKRVYAG